MTRQEYYDSLVEDKNLPEILVTLRIFYEQFMRCKPSRIFCE